VEKNGRLTARRLEKLEACPCELQRFKRAFPRGLAITEKNAVLASRRSFSVSFLVCHLSYRARDWHFREESKVRWGREGRVKSREEAARLVARAWHKFPLPMKMKKL